MESILKKYGVHPPVHGIHPPFYGIHVKKVWSPFSSPWDPSPISWNPFKKSMESIPQFMESSPHSMDSILKKYGVHPPFHGFHLEFLEFTPLPVEISDKTFHFLSLFQQIRIFTPYFAYNFL